MHCPWCQQFASYQGFKLFWDDGKVFSDGWKQGSLQVITTAAPKDTSSSNDLSLLAPRLPEMPGNKKDWKNGNETPAVFLGILLSAAEDLLVCLSAKLQAGRKAQKKRT